MTKQHLPLSARQLSGGRDIYFSHLLAFLRHPVWILNLYEPLHSTPLSGLCKQKNCDLHMPEKLICSPNFLSRPTSVCHIHTWKHQCCTDNQFCLSLTSDSSSLLLSSSDSEEPSFSTPAFASYPNEDQINLYQLSC